MEPKQDDAVKAKPREIVATDKLASADGGTLDYLSVDGELLLSVAVPAGLVSAGKYLALAPEGVSIEVNGLAVVPASGNAYGKQPYGPGATETAANPDFKPSSADAMARQLAQLTRQVAVLSRAPERRQRAADAVVVERVPQAAVEAKQVEAKPEAKAD